MANYNGQLTQNEVFSSIYNMIISQRVFANDIAENFSELLNMSKVDGSMYGDTKLYYSTDINKSEEWLGDAEAANLLELNRPEDPECQEIHIDKTRMVTVSTDQYMTKRAFKTPEAFSEFNSRIIAWVEETKRVYETTLINTFIGTNETEVGNQKITFDLPEAGVEPSTFVEKQAFYELQAEHIAQNMADLLVDLKDISRDYNDYQNLRAYDPNDLVFVFNSEWVNRIRKVSLPTIFHKDGLIDKFAEHVLPARFFGKIDTDGGTADGTQRSLIEKDYNTVKMNESSYDAKKHVFPGDVIPTGEKFKANEAYVVDDTIICKVYHKDSVVYLSGFCASTEFINPRALTNSKYLIWLYSQPAHLHNYPFITIRSK